ncbi:MAG TPA: GDCCVxC domain-containing (seleno)protein [Roseiflexaceae bacterium]|nr:GDCCVxC domain-containing (seleno)protein [Roseiflexaceae bacterium]
MTTLHCPLCGFARPEPMPTDACVVMYACEQCGAVLSPKPGECCEFCSYGDDTCPPMQDEREFGKEMSHISPRHAEPWPDAQSPSRSINR